MDQAGPAACRVTTMLKPQTTGFFNEEGPYTLIPALIVGGAALSFSIAKPAAAL